MRSVSVRNIDDETYERIREYALSKGTSINRAIVESLEDRFRPEKTIQHHDMDDLIGSWSEEQFKEFQDSLEEQRKIDDELWQ